MIQIRTQDIFRVQIMNCTDALGVRNWKKEGKMARKTEPKASDTVYMMVNTRDRSKAGVISHAVNCGYSDEQLKSMAKFGWKLKEGKA